MNTRRLTILAAAAIAMLAASLWHLHVINRDMPSTHSDLVPVWVGVRATIAGQDPYSDATTRATQIAYYGRALRPSDGDMNRMGYVYPAYTAIALAWLAPLGWPTVRLICLVIFAAITAASVPLWLDIAGMQITRSRALLTTLIVMVSWPIMWALRLQQVSLLVAALVALGCWLLKRNRNVAAGVLLALATIKPQLVAPLLAWLLLWSILARRWRFIASLTASIGALLAAAQWLSPGWFPRWREAGIDLMHYTHQQPALETFFGGMIGRALMIALAVLAAAALWRLRKCSADSAEFGTAISVALGVTLALMPTTMPMIYNQVFLVPGCLLLVHTASRSIARSVAMGALAWGFVATPIAAIGETLSHSPTLQLVPFWNLLLPVAVVAALGIGDLPLLYRHPDRRAIRTDDHAEVVEA